VSCAPRVRTISEQTPTASIKAQRADYVVLMNTWSIHYTPRNAHGWTLLELLLAVTVAGTLMALAMASYAQFREKALIAQAKIDLSNFMQVFERYRVSRNGQLPLSLADVGLAGQLDPWGNPYMYLNFTTVKGKGDMRKDHNLVPINTEFDLYSMGPDGNTAAPLTAKASRDDIIVANDGAFIGPASDY
jgi:general secretion pathway protein G